MYSTFSSYCLKSQLAFQVLGSVGGQAGQHIVLQQQVEILEEKNPTWEKIKVHTHQIYLQQAAAGQSQPQIIQTTDGQTLIYQPVQVENQGQPQQASQHYISFRSKRCSTPCQ